jgi:hypothetical protein
MALEQVLHQRNLSSDTDRLYSPAIWGDCPVLGLLAGTVDGVIDGDDFVAPGDEDGNDTGGYERYIDTSDTIRTLAVDTTAVATGSRGGVLRLSIAATDNNAPVIQRTSANGAGTYLIGNTAGAAWKLWFECRVRKSSVADDVSAFFAGLAEVGVVANDGLLEDNTGTLVDDISAIGFNVKHVNSGTAGQNAIVNFVYNETTATTAPTELATSLDTMVASTWVKLGFVYDPNGPTSQKIKIFVNNREQSTYGTTTTIDLSSFPENDAMCVAFGAKAGSGTASTFDIDWWRVAQVYSGF